MIRPGTTSFFSTAPPTAAKDSAVLIQASDVRSRDIPGSRSSGSSVMAVAVLAVASLLPSLLSIPSIPSLPEGRDQDDDGRHDRHHGDYDGEQPRHDGPWQRLAAAHGPLAAGPFPVGGHGDDRAEHDQRHAEDVPAPRDAGERRQQLDHAQPGHYQRERGPAPGQEGALVGEGPAWVGFGALVGLARFGHRSPPLAAGHDRRRNLCKKTLAAAGRCALTYESKGTQGGAGIWSPGNYHDPGTVRQLAWGGRLVRGLPRVATADPPRGGGGRPGRAVPGPRRLERGPGTAENGRPSGRSVGGS